MYGGCGVWDLTCGRAASASENMVKDLAIETSCDETAAAIGEDGRRVLSNCLMSQICPHQAFGGVVPEVAAREHLEVINQTISEAFSLASLTHRDLDGIACTVGPGLIGTLLVGITAAK